MVVSFFQTQSYGVKYFNFSRIHANLQASKINLARLTLPLKSLLPLASVWSKTTLDTGGVGRAGADPQNLKMGTSFLMSLALRMSIFNMFQ